MFSQVYDGLEVLSDQVIVGFLPPGQLDSTTAQIQLSLPITLSPGQTDSLDLRGDISALALVTGYELSIADSSYFVIRDLSSGSPLVAGTDTILSSGLVFPMSSGWSQILSPAQSSEYCVSGSNPASVLAGTDDVPLLDLEFVQPAGSTFSPARIEGVRLEAIDSVGVILNPQDLFDRIGISLAGASTTYQPFVQVQGDAVQFWFSDTGLVLLPADTLRVRLAADLEADVPFDHFKVRITSAGDFDLVDATDTTVNLDAVPAGGCVGTIPFITNTTQVILPAGQPVLAWPEDPVLLTQPGATGVALLETPLDYSSATPQADIDLHTLKGRLFARTASGRIPIPAAAVLASVDATFNSMPLATDSVLSGDSIILSMPATYPLANGTSGDLKITADLHGNAAAGNYVIEFSDSTFMELTDANIGVPVYPFILGQSYPLLSRELSVTAAGLGASFTNYPNPFSPSRGEVTTIGFSLASDARVDVQVFTITGQHVIDLTKDELRTAGAHQSDTWDGVNDQGLNVASGTYFCRVTARFVSGGEEVARRKMAVVR